PCHGCGAPLPRRRLRRKPRLTRRRHVSEGLRHIQEGKRDRAPRVRDARRRSTAEAVETGGREGAADLHQALLGRLGRGIDLAVHRLGDAGALAGALGVARLLVALRTPRPVVAARLLLPPSAAAPTGEMAGLLVAADRSSRTSTAGTTPWTVPPRRLG